MNEPNPPILESNRSQAGSDVLSRAQETVRKAKRSPASDSVKPAKETSEDKKAKALARELDKLYSAEFFTPLMRAPADIMLAISGDKIWNMEDKEAQVLGGSAATTARYFMELHPKWVALAILCTALTTSYGSRTALYMRKKRANGKDNKSVT